ncbi:MAG: sigma-54-dependent Fis family transcriptional regulator [Ignavibacteriae bacterium]|nr:sigma-54-dependent Fis family transcriptional regulator [Ignavibacteriota bacterium]
MSNRECGPASDGREHISGLLMRMGIVGDDPAVYMALHRAEKFADKDKPVLIQGESGTGKELFARAIHYLSKRSRKPFEDFQPSACPEALVGNELFGHYAGAFTGAGGFRPGIIDRAAGGTLFLDEVQSLSPALQVELLRILDTQEYRPLGGGARRRADVRIVCACNVDLLSLVEAGTFRHDLYYRMAWARIEVPPLRERRGDILLLADHFLEKSILEGGGTRKLLSEGARKALLAYQWPGNVRELASTIQSAATMVEGDEICAEDLEFPGQRDELLLLPLDQAVADSTRQFVGRYIRELLAMYNGNMARVAETACLDRSSIYRLIREHGIEINTYRRSIAM